MYLYCLLLLVLTTATDNQHGIVLVKLHSAPRDLSLACFDQDTITTDESSHTPSLCLQFSSSTTL